MKTNELLYGFRVVSERESRELGGTLWELRHEKTGAPLYWTDNGEENKLFCVTFKTIPEDDTGVFHILEHSVLCGSEKFPVKEPFLDLLKSSMNTFLNAFTAPDHTSYPVSSKNEQDFMNLVEVYLDAVFRPAILREPSIFLQEGRRIDFGKHEPEYNGVVFNEMKGSMANDAVLLDRALRRALFPDTCYGFVSGGLPEAIPELTYEAFIAAYKKFYHPSNCIIYLDGAVPTDRALPLIASYLDSYERDDTVHEIAMQPPVAARRIEAAYEIGAGESAENRTLMAFGKHVGRFDDRKKLAALEILDAYLFDSNEAPLKKALMSEGLARDARFSVYLWNKQPYCSLSLRGTEAEHRDALMDALHTAAAQLLEKGLDPEELNAAIDNMELSNREMDEPQGLERSELLLLSRLYGGDPLLYIENDALIADLRAAVGTDYYADLVREYFISEEHLVEAVLRPDPEKGRKDREKEKARLRAFLDSTPPQELSEQKELFRRFRLWQDTPDSDDARKTLPSLTLADVEPLPEKIDTQDMTGVDGGAYLFHQYKTNGLSYISLYFNASDLPLDRIPALSFAAGLLGELPTEKYSVPALQREMKRLLGSFSASLSELPAPKGGERVPENAQVFLRVDFSALSSRLDEAIALVEEILLRSDLGGADRIKKLLSQRREQLFRAICSSGNRSAVYRALSPYSAEYTVRDASSGIGLYRYLKALDEQYAERAGEFRETAQSLLARALRRGRLTASETAEEFHGQALRFYDLIPDGGEPAPVCGRFELPEKERKEAFVIPGGVSYAAQCAGLDALDSEYDGGMTVLSSILSYDYLWNEIRVRGGAYGCRCSLSQTGGVQFTSYRDPKPGRSLDIYAAASDYIRAFCASEDGIENYIISSVAGTQPLLEPSEMGAVGDQLRLRNETYEDRCLKRRQMLELKKEDLLSYCGMFDRAAEKGARCVIGAKTAVDALGEGWKVEEL